MKHITILCRYSRILKKEKKSRKKNTKNTKKHIRMKIQIHSKVTEWHRRKKKFQLQYKKRKICGPKKETVFETTINAP